MSEGGLPKRFSDLEPFIEWSLPTEAQRIAMRLDRPDEELRSFYNAMLPKLDDIAQYLNQFPLDRMSNDAERLLDLAKSFMEVAQSVEYGRSKVASHFDVFRFVPMHEKRS
jgi:hypothetical protein